MPVWIAFANISLQMNILWPLQNLANTSFFIFYPWIIGETGTRAERNLSSVCNSQLPMTLNRKPHSLHLPTPEGLPDQASRLQRSPEHPGNVFEDDLYKKESHLVSFP